MIDDPITDEYLIQAMRKRLLEQIGSGGGSNVINNNIYGRGEDPEEAQSMGGIQSQMGGEGASPEDRDYFVDILKQQYEPGDQAEFYNPQSESRENVDLKQGGWGKKVHRFSVPKKKKTFGDDGSGIDLPDLPEGATRDQISKEDFLRQIMSNGVDPMNYAGESYTATDEIARASDINNPYIRGKVRNEGDYWPGPDYRR